MSTTSLQYETVECKPELLRLERLTPERNYHTMVVSLGSDPAHKIELKPDTKFPLKPGLYSLLSKDTPKITIFEKIHAVKEQRQRIRGRIGT